MTTWRDENRIYICLMMNKMIHGGVVTSAETAIAIGEAILKGHYGKGGLAKQRPLNATEQGETWLVEGSYQEPGRLSGAGSWYVIMQKHDAAVIELGHRMPMDIPDDVKAIIETTKNDREEGGAK